jgi:type VI secretion system secreted protein Hcp
MAFDTFLKLAGIEGESTDTKHAKEIEILSFSFGASNPASIGSATTGAGVGKVSISSFNVMKKVDKASVKLFEKCCKGEHIDQANVVLRKAGGTALEFLKYEFKKVFVDSIQHTGSAGGDDSAAESVSFSFGSVKISYNQQDVKGGGKGDIDVMWSVVKNAPTQDV